MARDLGELPQSVCTSLLRIIEICCILHEFARLLDFAFLCVFCERSLVLQIEKKQMEEKIEE